MKKAFLGLMLVVACLAGLPPTQRHTLTMSTIPFRHNDELAGSVTGFITTSCDSCISDREQCSVLVIHGKRRHERQLVKSRLRN